MLAQSTINLLLHLLISSSSNHRRKQGMPHAFFVSVIFSNSACQRIFFPQKISLIPEMLFEHFSKGSGQEINCNLMIFSARWRNMATSFLQPVFCIPQQLVDIIIFQHALNFDIGFLLNFKRFRSRYPARICVALFLLVRC